MMTKEERRLVCWQNAQKCRKQNAYEMRDGIVYVKMSNSDNYMLCDPDDWERWKQYTWCENNSNHYVETHINGKKEKYHKHLIPRVRGMVVDHINRNKLDNRRCNIRLASVQVNSINTSLSKANTSGVKGVRKLSNGKWGAYIFVNRKSHWLGSYYTIEEATDARKKGEEKYFSPIICKETLI